MNSFLQSSSFPYIPLLLAIPFVGSFLVAVIPEAQKNIARWIGVAVSLVVLGLTIAMGAAFSTTAGGYQFVTNHSWASSLGISWFTGVDGISLFLVGLTALIVPIALLGANEHRKTKAYVAWMLLLETACIGSFVSLDLVLFFLFFELTLIPSYFLIVGWGGQRRAAAATKFFIYTFAGSAFLLVGILFVAYLHQQQTGVFTFNLIDLMNTHYSGTAGVLLLAAFTVAFAIKAPLFPFHTWSPDTYGESPAGVAMVLSAVLAKLGAYGMIRFDLALFPHAIKVAAPVLLTLATIVILYDCSAARHIRHPPTSRTSRAGTGVGGGLYRCDDGVDRLARACWFCRGVLGAHRDLHYPPMVGGGSHARCGGGSDLSSVGLSTLFPRKS